MRIHTKRIYDKPARADGQRVLVDRLWPRGVSKDDAKLDAWLKDVAPSDALRKWFGHDETKWDEFRKRYFRELDKQDGAVQQLEDMAREKTLTLLYGAKDEQHNNAEALREYLERHG